MVNPQSAILSDLMPLLNVERMMIKIVQNLFL